MKKSNACISIIIMAMVAIISIPIIKTASKSYTEKTKVKYQQLTKPIQLYWEEKNTLWYSVILKDAKGTIVRFGNLSKVANYIGKNYQIGDTVNYPR
jgi:hypothetical protein